MLEEFIHHILNDLSIGAQLPLGILFLLFVIQLYYYFRYYNKIIQYGRKVRKNKVNITTAHPPVSVIICAQNESDNLEKFLPRVLDQDYPTYEVIVVNDGSTDETSDLLDKLSKKHSNLYQTFLPMDAKYMSRKKMCLSVGIKAAKYEYLLLLDADCEPASNHWIQQMMSNYVKGTDIVLGYSKPVGATGFLEKIIRYSSITTAMRFMGFALCHNPYMGTGRNLCYKKSCFQNSVGFSNQLNLTAGDDSLFIQQVATPTNTRVEFYPNSITLAHREETFKSFCYQKSDMLKAMKKAKGDIRFSINLEDTTRLLFYLFSLIAIIALLAMQEWILAGVAGFLFVFRFITQVIIIRGSAEQLSEKKFFLLIPVLDIFTPLLSAYLQTFGAIGNKENDLFRC